MQIGGIRMIKTDREQVELAGELYNVLPLELVEELKKHAPIKLMSSIKVAETMGRTRQWVDWAIKKYPDQFPKPVLEVNRFKGWLATDIIDFRDNILPTLPTSSNKKDESNTENK